jgi:hypothetical protein
MTGIKTSQASTTDVESPLMSGSLLALVIGVAVGVISVFGAVADQRRRKGRDSKH